MPSAAQFIADRRDRWTRLEALLAKSEGNGLRRLNASELDALSSGYRAVVADLAIAQRDYPDDTVTLALNQLAARAHLRLYQAPGGSWRRLLQFFTTDFGRRVRAERWYVLASAALLFGPALWAYLAALLDPTLRGTLVPADLRAVMASGRTWTDMEPVLRPFMATVIFTNNIRVALTTFAGGILLGLGTLYVLVSNGLMLGSILGAGQHYGVSSLLLAFISAHGYLELSAIVLAGAAGLILGDGLLRPGLLRRRDAATRGARRAVELAVGTVPILIVAGMVEGFVSPSGLPSLAKEALGPCLGIALWASLLTLGRTGPRQMRPRSFRSR